MVQSSDFMRALTMEDNSVVLIFSGDPKAKSDDRWSSSM